MSARPPQLAASFIRALLTRTRRPQDRSPRTSPCGILVCEHLHCRVWPNCLLVLRATQRLIEISVAKVNAITA